MTKPRFNYFKSPDTDLKDSGHILFYCEWGDPKNSKVAICVHGLSRNCRDFDYLAAVLQEDYRVICVDIAGRGRSEWLDDKNLYNYETYVTDIVNLINHLEIKQLDWIGTSMGGIIGMMIASRYPHIIRKLFLNDIGPIIPGAAIKRITDYVASNYEFASKSDAELGLKQRMVSFGIKNEEHWRHLIKHSIVKKMDGKYCFAYDPDIINKPKLSEQVKGFFDKIVNNETAKAPKDVNLMDIWHKVNCPIFVLRGGLSDVLTKEVCDQMKLGKKDITFYEIGDVGHAPVLMEDEQISIVKHWL